MTSVDSRKLLRRKDFVKGTMVVFIPSAAVFPLAHEMAVFARLPLIVIAALVVGMAWSVTA